MATADEHRQDQGSRYGSSNAPYVNWFDNDQPNMNANSVGNRNPNYGSGSRGTAKRSDNTERFARCLLL